MPATNSNFISDTTGNMINKFNCNYINEGIQVNKNAIYTFATNVYIVTTFSNKSVGVDTA